MYAAVHVLSLFYILNLAGYCCGLCCAFVRLSSPFFLGLFRLCCVILCYIHSCCCCCSPADFYCLLLQQYLRSYIYILPSINLLLCFLQRGCSSLLGRCPLAMLLLSLVVVGLPFGTDPAAEHVPRDRRERPVLSPQHRGEQAPCVNCALH